MSYGILGLGLLLTVCGSYAVYFGYGIVAVERGWSSVIAGATALSCGIVTIALALILRLSSLLLSGRVLGRLGCRRAALLCGKRQCGNHRQDKD